MYKNFNKSFLHALTKPQKDPKPFGNQTPMHQWNEKTDNTFKLLPQVFFENTLFFNELHVLFNQSVFTCEKVIKSVFLGSFTLKTSIISPIFITTKMR
jgi:hypothetical protein